MNLLDDAWIPVRADGGAGEFKQITYEELLCHEGNWQISLPRDDMEFACLQLLVCLTQVIFMPSDDRDLRVRIKIPLTAKEFRSGISAYKEWFDLEHVEYPFMQTHKTGTTKTTPIQKLFVGLPEGNNHAFFNRVEEISRACPSCAAIALFNLCSNAPNISGKHKGGLRGGSAISTLILGDDLRQTVWLNVITVETSNTEMCIPLISQPVWKEPIVAGANIPETTIGLLRGLFWSPILIELKRIDAKNICDCCGTHSDKIYREFYLGSDFKFNVSGKWPHPHTPRMWATHGDRRSTTSYFFFNAKVPAWTQLSEYVVPKNTGNGNEGQIPAVSVTQFNRLFQGEALHLVVGGYVTDQASILQRRHELFSIAKGWDENPHRLEELIKIAVKTRDVLTKHTNTVRKGIKNKKVKLKGVGVPIQKTAESFFYATTEGLIHDSLRFMKWREFIDERQRISDHLAIICKQIYHKLTAPFTYKTEFIAVVAVARKRLEKDLHNLMKGAGRNDNKRREGKQNVT